MAGVRVQGTDEFARLARDLREAGNGKLVRQLTDSIRTSTRPIEDAQKRRVQSLVSQGVGGGASARSARAAALLARRKSPSEAAKLEAHRSSGLRQAAARTVQTSVRAGGNTASVRIKSNSSRMPADQRKLPMAMNRGKWRHPVFNRPAAWAMQTVTPDEWFDEPAEEGAPRVHAGVVDTLDNFLDRVL